MVVGLVACGDGEAETAAAVAAVADARAIAEVIAVDPAADVLEDVSDAIDTDRPVLAADLLDEVGLPAMRRAVTNLEAVAVTSADGRTIRARAVRLYRARVSAYEDYQRLLMRGLVDDESLLDALDAVSENERELLALQRELRTLAPSAAAEPPPADEAEPLAGLPPVARGGAAPPDDETPGAAPDVAEEHPAELEDALPEM